ncbi:MAG: sel1 repeat family protein [Thermochromatium sp.]
MHWISLNTAAALTGLTKRTLWRYRDSGRLTTLGPGAPGHRTQVALAEVLALSGLTIAAEHQSLIVAADRGDPMAQCDLGILLLMNQRPAAAIDWFKRSAAAFYPDAMFRLARAYLVGDGVAPDPAVGLHWLHQAASRGHPVAQALSRFLAGPDGQRLLRTQDPTALQQALDDLERRTLLNALANASQP